MVLFHHHETRLQLSFTTICDLPHPFGVARAPRRALAGQGTNQSSRIPVNAWRKTRRGVLRVKPRLYHTAKLLQQSFSFPIRFLIKSGGFFDRMIIMGGGYPLPPLLVFPEPDAIINILMAHPAKRKHR